MHTGTRRDTTEGGARARARCMGRQGVRGVGVARARARACVGTLVRCPCNYSIVTPTNSTIGQYYIHK